jgi:hypothetical protein
MRTFVAIICFFGFSVALAESTPDDPRIPPWARDVDCGSHAHLAPHQKIALDHPLSEIEQQLRAEYEVEALIWLRLAQERAGWRDVSEEVCYALEYAKLAELSPEELQITSNQLRNLQIKGWRAEAVRQYRLAKERSASGDAAAEEMTYAREFAERVLKAAKSP